MSILVKFAKQSHILYLHSHKRCFSNVFQNNITQNFQKIQLQQQVLSGKYLWGIKCSSVSGLERSIHNYYYELLKLLCDSSTSLQSLSDNFDDEIFEFIMERGSHPGIPLFHLYRTHNLSSFNDGFLNPENVQVKLIDFRLMLDCNNHVIYNESDAIAIGDEENDTEEDIEQIKKRLSHIYKDTDALQEALKQLNLNSNTKTVDKSKSVKTRTQSVEIDINDEPIPIYLQCKAYIYNGDENDRIDDIISNGVYVDPKPISDFINVNLSDWNRLFLWRLITQHPIGYIECNDDVNKQNKLKISIDKILIQQLKQIENGNINVLNSYRIAQHFRSQVANKISSWKVIDANETIM